MKIFNEGNSKNTQNHTDVAIGITDEKDDDRKFKFKRPLMLKIFIPLSIITLTTLLICLLTLSDNYELITDESSLQNEHFKNIISRNYNNRRKRQLEYCTDCEQEELDFYDSIIRCKKNLQEEKECCDLYNKVKELNLLMDKVKTEFELLDVPCKLNHLESGEKSSISSSSTKKEQNTKSSDENTAQEEEDNKNRFFHNGDDNHLNYDGNKYKQNEPQYVTPLEIYNEVNIPTDKTPYKEKSTDAQDYDINIHYQVKNNDYTETTIHNNFDNDNQYIDRITTEEIPNTSVDFNAYDQQTTNKNTYNHFISQEIDTQNISDNSNNFNNTTPSNTSYAEEYFDGNINVPSLENITDTTTKTYEKNTVDQYNTKEETTKYSAQQVFYDHFDDKYDINVNVKINEETTTVKYDNGNSYQKKLIDYEDEYPNKYTSQDEYNLHNIPEETYNTSSTFVTTQQTQNTEEHYTTITNTHHYYENTDNNKASPQFQQVKTTENQEEYSTTNSNNQNEQYTQSNTKIIEESVDYLDFLQQLQQLEANVITEENVVENNTEKEAHNIVIQPTNLYEEDKTEKNEDHTENTNKNNLYNNEETTVSNYDAQYTLNNYEDQNINNKYDSDKQTSNFYNNEETTDNIYDIKNTYKDQLGNEYSNNEEQNKNEENIDKDIKHTPQEEFYDQSDEKYDINFKVKVNEETTTTTKYDHENPYQKQQKDFKNFDYNNENTNFYDNGNVNKEENSSDKQEYVTDNYRSKETDNTYNTGDIYKENSSAQEEEQNEDVNIHLKVHEGKIYEITTETKPETIEDITTNINYYEPENNYYDKINMENHFMNLPTTTEKVTTHPVNALGNYPNYDDFTIDDLKSKINDYEINFGLKIEENADPTTTQSLYHAETRNYYETIEDITTNINYYEPENNYYDKINMENHFLNLPTTTEKVTTLSVKALKDYLDYEDFPIDDLKSKNNDYEINFGLKIEENGDTTTTQSLYHAETKNNDETIKDITTNINYYEPENNYYDKINKENHFLNLPTTTEKVTTLSVKALKDYVDYEDFPIDDLKTKNNDYEINFGLKIEDNADTTTTRSLYHAETRNNDDPDEMDLENLKNSDQNLKYDQSIAESNSVDYYTDSQGKPEEIGQVDKNILLEEITTKYEEEAKITNYEELTTTEKQNQENTEYKIDKQEENHYKEFSTTSLPVTPSYSEDIVREFNKLQDNYYNEYPTTITPEPYTFYSTVHNNLEFPHYNYYESQVKEDQENIKENPENEPLFMKKKIEVIHEDEPEEIYQKAKGYNTDLIFQEDPNLKLNAENHEKNQSENSDENNKDLNITDPIMQEQDPNLKLDSENHVTDQTGNSDLDPNLQEKNLNFFPALEETPETQNESDTDADSRFHSKGQARQDGNGDIRIVNQNPIAQRFQNTGNGVSSKFDNIFQMPPLETSKASQQLTVNTNMLPMCFYGFPGGNGPMLRQPGYESQMNPFSMSNTYGAFGYPQMFPNSVSQPSMLNFYNSLMGQQKMPQSNMFNQSPYNSNPYFCTYVPSSSLQFPPVTGLQEFRDSNKKMAVLEDLDDKTLPKNWIPTLINTNKSRNSLNCLPNEKSCFDGIQCIKSTHWCDGIVQCHDKSDELGCPCKTRVDKSRLCDGYFDCPNGEDELGCFGCNEAEFSCDDWSERQKTATCVPLDERCDGIPQCKTGKDEMDCSLLTNSVNVHQTYAVSKSSGYLHRNFKGNWYPVCSNTDSWALDACLAEVGPQATFPLVHMLPVPSDYTGEFLTALPDKKVQFLKSCVNGEAIYVICPPIPCGTRILPPLNQYRKHEVDTSAEEDFLPFVSRLRRFTEELHKVDHHPNILSSNDFMDKKKHITLEDVKQRIDITNDTEWSFEEQERIKRGETRVVGGKPSQPTSWPWVIAIYRDGIFHCGGVLMSEFWIITAAHCVDTYWQHYYEVQAGMLRRFSFSPMEQNRVVAHVIGHQMYDRTDMKNDLALLKVNAPFQFNRWVRPVCLPSESSAGPKWMWGPEPGTICTAVGWGATIEHGPDPDHMREVEVPILSQCKHREDQEGQEICAGYLEGGRDACQGDSGGPLLCRNPLAPSQWYVAGIVSHGEGCARPNEPGAYTRVSLYLNWIARSVLEENLPKRQPIQKCPGTLCVGTRRCIPKKRKCDKTVDCLVGDDEIDCPKHDYSSLIKHAFDNMLLFASLNVTNNTNFEAFINKTKINQTINNEMNHNSTGENEESFKNVHESADANINTFEDARRNISNSSASQDTNTERTGFTEEDIRIITQTFQELNNENFIPANNKSDIPIYFECRKILQLIPMSRHCDNVIDCEDGTDEVRCSCKGYLHASYPKAICDGIVDCFDGSDEANCMNCPPDYFHCHLSQQCIPAALQCNHLPDCFFGEDEWDCFALTNDTYIRYDIDDRPELRMKGVMSFSFSGQWSPLCSNDWFQSAHDVAGDMCAYLGYSGFQKYFEILVRQSTLEILSHNETSLTLRPTNETCRALYVKCSNSLSDTGDMKKIYTAHQSGANTFKEVLMSPWNAAIFVDGVYTCSGTLIEKDWVITSRTCLHIDLRRNYTTVVFGAGRGHMNVVGPHEQIRLVSELVQILLTDVAILRLEKPVTFTRYVRPLYIRLIGNDIVSDRETCTVLGKENDSFMQAIVLKPSLERCLRGKRCFKRVTPLGKCDTKTTPSWGGTIVCLSETGWYPAAVYFDQKGPCGFLTSVEYTSIRSLKARIISTMNKHEFPIKPPECNGVRCPMGQCVNANRLCDGIPDCRDGSDENEEVCEEKKRRCQDGNNCACAPSELRCHNAKCIPKSAFCDRVNDCGDWSDEPARCNCSSYLSLTAPHRLCDGIANCLDKSDENPQICGCRSDSFKCERSEVCIPNEWVCDGVADCPNKEDETVCLALRQPEGERDGVGEVVLRSYGVWHSYCMRGEVLAPPDLEDICRRLGYSTAHAAAVNGTFTRPAQGITEENFSLVRFNKYMMMFLKGNYPVAKVKNNEDCERLYIECTPP